MRKPMTIFNLLLFPFLFIKNIQQKSLLVGNKKVSLFVLVFIFSLPLHADDLVISKTASDIIVEVNATVEYTLAIANESNKDETNVTVIDILPNVDGITNFDILDDGGFTCTLEHNYTTQILETTFPITALPLESKLICTDGEVAKGTAGDPVGINRIIYKLDVPSYPVELVNTAKVNNDNESTFTVSVIDSSVGGYIPPPPEHADIIDTFTSINDYNLGTSKVIQTKIAAQEFVPITAVHLDGSSQATTYTHSDDDVSFVVIPYLSNGTCTTQEWIIDSNTDLPLVINIPNGSESRTEYMDVAAFARRDSRVLVSYLDLGAILDDTGVKCVYSSSTQGNLAGLGQCVNSANNYYDAFGLTSYERCNVLNGQPCESENGGESCGQAGPGCPGYNPLYDNPLGCLMCTLNAFPECSSDNFAIRPDKFDVNITDTTPQQILIAGKDTSLVFKALNRPNTATPIPVGTYLYDENELISFSVDINISDTTKICQNQDINMAPNVDFTNGVDQGIFVFDDIGDVNMTIHEINGTEFALVDVNDTNDTQRLITEFTVPLRILPDHFNIDANLTDHNSDNNFTYLHDINRYDSDDNHSMAAALTIDIQAMGEDNNITHNYMETCYAKDTNLTLALGSTDITYPGSVVPLTHFLYYNPEEDNGTPDSGEGNYTLPSLTGITSLPIENIAATFSDDAPEGNGTTRIEYKLNFDRKQNLVVNPFKLQLTDVNITDTDGVEGTTGGTLLPNQEATLYYARSRSSQFFYDDITNTSVKTPILIDVYCDLGFTACDSLGIDTVNGQINEINWWLSLGHTENGTQHDGNITLYAGSDTVTEGTGSPTVSPTNIQITSSGKDENVTVTSNASDLPMTVEIELVRESDTPTPSNYTNEWLIYNPNYPLPLNPFYKVRFIGQAGWAGHGDTGHVVDSNVSTKKNRRLGW